MKPNPAHRLPAPLESAVQSLKLAARGAVERTIESLGLSALAAGNAYQRDGLLGAQFELNRKSAVFVLTFNDAFDERVMREAGAVAAAAAPVSSKFESWDTMSLVEDHEVEVQISAERFGMDVAHACDWELREFNAYVAALLQGQSTPAGAAGLGDGERNPLRPEVVGHAMIRAVEAVSERPETRKLLAAEIGRSLRGMLRPTYASIVADLRNAGVQPLGMSMRAPSARSAAATAAFANAAANSRSAGLDDGRGGPLDRHAASGQRASDGDLVSRRFGGSSFGPSTRHGASRGGVSLGQVDPALMSLIRRLAYLGAHDSAVDSGMAGSGGSDHAQHDDTGGRGDFATGGRGPVPPNLIHAHRDALRQASTGSLDHMVIDVIAGLFDQILSDPKVPPQMARQIGRLQLPVLRAALGDTSFFSSRRHPVRRFINRIASLGAAFEDFSDATAQRFLAKVKDLVQEVVDGDFDQIETYEQQLRALESFMAELARQDVDPQGMTAELLSQKEDEQRLRQLYAQRLEGDLKGLAAPQFVRDFIARTWSQVLLRAAQQGGADGPLAQRLRHAGRELFMSVQPKSSPAARKIFLDELPRLMLDLTEGLNLIGWPEAERRAFFGQLMPAHAEALKNLGARLLDNNLLARQLDGVLLRPMPSREDLAADRSSLPVLTDAVTGPQFSADEARRVGLVEETAVDWTKPAAASVDIDLSAIPDSASAPLPRPQVKAPTAITRQAVAQAGVALPAEPVEPADPTQGKALAEHVQIGFAYQMQLQGQWQKVRLSHISTGRSFFVFTHGSRHKQTISMTQRMLVRLCEAGRLRAFENAYLIERATERARRQLSAVGSRHSTH
jgi:hypothetical protein